MWDTEAERPRTENGFIGARPELYDQMDDVETETLRAAGKVGRTIAKYELEGVPGELAARWTGESGERESLRSLAHYFNRRVLGVALRDADVETVDDVDRMYRVLIGEAGSAGDRTSLRNRLEREGVPVDQVESDFVSHQTIHTFLTDHLDVAYAADDTSQLKKDVERLNRLESRLAAVTSDVVDRSRRTDRIRVGDAEVFVETRVLCADCGGSYTAQTLLDRGGCDCES